MKPLVFALAAGLAGCAAQTPQSSPPQTAPAAATPGAESVAAATTDYACSLVLGIGVTSEWFDAGFEQLAGDGRWEAVFRKHTFVQDWADPAHEAWREPVVSPCAAQADAPDRVLFVAANWELPDAAAWLEPLRGVVGTIRAKYPSVKRIELMTVVRPPGNASCGAPKSAVAPFIDEAIAQVSRGFPELVQAAPKFELSSCDGFTKGGPHLTPEGAAQAAKLIAAHYAQ